MSGFPFPRRWASRCPENRPLSEARPARGNDVRPARASAARSTRGTGIRGARPWRLHGRLLRVVAALTAACCILAGVTPANGQESGARAEASLAASASPSSTQPSATSPAASDTPTSSDTTSSGRSEQTGRGGPTSTAKDSERTDKKEQTGKVEITSVGSDLIKPDTDLSVTATFTNSGSKAVTISRASLKVQTSVPVARSQLVSFLRGGGADPELLDEDDQEQRLEPGQSVNIGFSVPARKLDWNAADGDWGPRGVEVEVDFDDESASDRSIIVVEPDSQVQPMQASVVLPITRSTRELSDTSSVEGMLDGEPEKVPKRLPDTLSTMATPGVTAAVDPLLVESADATMSDALRTFTGASGTQLLLTAPGDADLAAIAHTCDQAEEDEEADECSNARFSAGTTRAEAASEAVSSQYGVTPRTDIPLLAPHADAGVVDALSRADASGVILHGSDATRDDDSSLTASARTSVKGVPAVTSDAAMSATFAGVLPSSGRADTDQVGDDSKSLGALDSKQLVLGLSAVTYRERPSEPRATVIEVDRASLPSLGTTDPATAKRDTPLTSGNMKATTEALMAAPWIEPATVDQILATEPQDGGVALDATSRAKGEATRAVIQQVDSGATQFSAAASIAVKPSEISDAAQAQAFQLMAVAWRSNPNGRSSRLNAFIGESLQFVTAISTRPSSTVNIISQNTEIPVNVFNSLPVACEVTVSLHSWDPRLKATKEITTTLAPRDSTKVQIPVKALGSGNITAEVRVVDAEGNTVGQPRTLDLRVRADWENIGTLVFGLFFLSLLVIGVVRSLKRGRRAQPISPQDLRIRQSDTLT
ncbi:MAG: DUF6049 family protein [Actinomycetaceae bacterium]|nr:DUF6049 family protein [Actinomycetaceae bacterium]